MDTLPTHGRALIQRIGSAGRATGLDDDLGALAQVNDAVSALTEKEAAVHSAAIEAALYPDEQFLTENYLYFCSEDPQTGELHFSRTLQEHEQAVSIYAPLWKQYDADRGIE